MTSPIKGGPLPPRDVAFPALFLGGAPPGLSSHRFPEVPFPGVSLSGLPYFAGSSLHADLVQTIHYVSEKLPAT